MLTTTKQLLLAHEGPDTGKGAELGHAYSERGDDDPISLVEILDSNGLDDALWALRAVPKEQRDVRDKLSRLMACDFAARVLYLYEDVFPNDDRPRQAIETARWRAVRGTPMVDLLNDWQYVGYAEAAAKEAAEAAEESAEYLARSAIEGARVTAGEDALTAAQERLTAARERRNAAVALWGAVGAAGAAKRAAGCSDYIARDVACLVLNKTGLTTRYYVESIEANYQIIFRQWAATDKHDLVRWGEESQEGYAPAYCVICGATIDIHPDVYIGCQHIERWQLYMID